MSNLLWYNSLFSENSLIIRETGGESIIKKKGNPFSFLTKFQNCLGFFFVVVFFMFWVLFSLRLNTDFHYLNTFLLCKRKHIPHSMEQRKRSNAKFFLLWDILAGWISTFWSASSRHTKVGLKRDVFGWQPLKQTLEKVWDGEVNSHFCAPSMLGFLLTFSVNTNNKCFTSTLEACLAIGKV